MPSFEEIYARHADQYELMVSREDVEENLRWALAKIIPPEGYDMVEFGAGTGRVTRLLAPWAREVWAFDRSHHMLGEAARQIAGGPLWNYVTLGVADNRQMPLRDGIADLAIEGWSFGHLRVWFAEDWQQEVGRALDEMERVLAPPDGVMILIETLGTNQTEPHPPSEELAELYRWLEEERGFSSTWVRTDYTFESLEEAVRLIGFFFGEEMAGEVAAAGSNIVPECTGIWWRRV